MGPLEEDGRQLERQWTLRRERARYEAERARRQYDTVEPENRLVARSLERAWEDKLRAAETIDQEYARWRSEEPVILSEADRAVLQTLGENLLQIWRAPTTLRVVAYRSDEAIAQTIDNDSGLRRKRDLLLSISGVGEIS